jgi:hypothetical protein
MVGSLRVEDVNDQIFLTETFAPVAEWERLRIILWAANAIEVGSTGRKRL